MAPGRASRLTSQPGLPHPSQQSRDDKGGPPAPAVQQRPWPGLWALQRVLKCRLREGATGRQAEGAASHRGTWGSCFPNPRLEGGSWVIFKKTNKTETWLGMCFLFLFFSSFLSFFSVYVVFYRLCDGGSGMAGWIIQAQKGSFIGKNKQTNPAMIYSPPLRLFIPFCRPSRGFDWFSDIVFSLQAASISGIPSVRTESINAACGMQKPFSRNQFSLMVLNAIRSYQASSWNSLPNVA